MKVARGFHNLRKAAGRAADGCPTDSRPGDSGCVLTVGNYDGVHLGHQRMIRVLKERAAELGCASTVLVFEPSSKEFIDPAGAPPRLTRWREKYLALAALGVDRLVTLRFDDEIRAMSPQCFVEQLLVADLNVRHLVVAMIFATAPRRRARFIACERPANCTASGWTRSMPSSSTACA